MFLAHVGAGLAAKRVAPRVNLAVLVTAGVLLDLVWPVLVLAGVERVHVEHGATAMTPFDFEHYPWSHSLGMALIWAAVFALGLKAFKARTADALVVGAVVLSHWVLDWISHRPDLPLWFGEGAKAGLGLWNSVTASVVLEAAVFALGVWLYAGSTTSLNRRGRWVFWSLVGLLSLSYLGNVLGPLPPPDLPSAAIAGPGMATWLFVALAFWADRHRRARAGLAGVEPPE